MNVKSRPKAALETPTETPTKKSKNESTARGDILADADALAESLRGYRRTYLYRSAAAAERCVARARERGRFAHVSICSLLPAGVVVGLGGGSR